jgi:hypothetical protein
MACLVAVMFFLSFWRSTRERLFLFFGLAFGALALHWVNVQVKAYETEHHPDGFAVLTGSLRAERIDHVLEDKPRTAHGIHVEFVVRSAYRIHL